MTDKTESIVLGTLHIAYCVLLTHFFKCETRALEKWSLKCRVCALGHP